MKKRKLIISLIIAALLFLTGIFVFETKLDTVIYFVLIITLFLTYNFSLLYRLFFILAGLLLVVSIIGYFLDPKELRFVHYIFKPAIWVYYFLLIGSLSSLVVNNKKHD